MVRLLRWGIEAITDVYRDATGLRLVELGHKEVAEARARLGSARKVSSEARKSFAGARADVEVARARAESIDRIDPRFPALIQQEHESLKTAAVFERKATESEELERIEFETLTGALERSHAQERDYAERTKWYSVTASLVGALFGLVGSTLVARSRNLSVTNVAQLQSKAVIDYVDSSFNRIDTTVKRVQEELKSSLEERLPARRGFAVKASQDISETGEEDSDANSAIPKDIDGGSPNEAIPSDEELATQLQLVQRKIREVQLLIVGSSTVIVAFSILVIMRGSDR